jgi:hypothetical protein
MSVTVYISGSWRYRGRVKRSGNPHTCVDMDHARNLCRKVIREARQHASLYRGRNNLFLADRISVRPEGTQPGDTVDVWTNDRGWHKGTLQSNGRVKSNPREN